MSVIIIVLLLVLYRLIYVVIIIVLSVLCRLVSVIIIVLLLVLYRLMSVINIVLLLVLYHAESRGKLLYIKCFVDHKQPSTLGEIATSFRILTR